LLRFGAGPRICTGITLSVDNIAFVNTRMFQRLKAMKSPEGYDDLRKVSRSPLHRRLG
jgi:cytochrome P450